MSIQQGCFSGYKCVSVSIILAQKLEVVGAAKISKRESWRRCKRKKEKRKKNSIKNFKPTHGFHLQRPQDQVSLQTAAHLSKSVWLRTESGIALRKRHTSAVACINTHINAHGNVNYMYVCVGVCVGGCIGSYIQAC